MVSRPNDAANRKASNDELHSQMMSPGFFEAGASTTFST